MRIALFTDATSHPNKGRTGISQVAFDVTDKQPRELFRQWQEIPYCNADDAEIRSGYEGLTRLVAIASPSDTLILFTDSSTVLYITEGMKRKGKSAEYAGALRQMKLDLGKRITVEQLPRRLNRIADYLAHKAINPIGAMFVPVQDRTEYIISTYPFVASLNASNYA